MFKLSRPESVMTNTLEGRPRPRVEEIRGSRASKIPSATSKSKWRRIPAGVKPKRSPNAAAVDGPFSSTERPTASRVRGSSVAFRAGPTFNFTTVLCRNSPALSTQRLRLWS